MQKIVPHLWFDTQAQQAAQFYTSLFDHSAIQHAATIHDTPSGNADILTITLAGQEFMLLNAGPYFKFNPSVSFMVACQTAAEVESLWKKFSAGGTALMELGSYPFSEKYGWIQDKFGLSWQLMVTGNREIPQKITPTLMFVGKQYGKTDEAIAFYTSAFHHAHRGDIMRYGQGEEPATVGTVKYASFMLENQSFAAMDGPGTHDFSFNEAISFIVRCETQEEIDYFWEKLSADPSAEQCGWLKDKYTLSWQIVPTIMDKMFSEGNEKKIARVTQAFLKMKKFDIQTLTQAYEGQ